VSDAATPLAPGDFAGTYCIESLLGEGGMGHVYRASGPEGPVAVKAIRPELVGDEASRRRFEREARVAQRIHHPNVVGVLASGERDGAPYIVQRFIPGGSLADVIDREGALPAGTIGAICAQVAAGLDAVHAAGLIHRDVKPGNILLDGDGTACLTDFGINKDTDGTVLTRPGQAVGSIDYMAPEQIRGEPVSAATDVYSLGCVLFECAVGRPPFADRQGLRAMWAHLEDPPPDPSRESADVPPPLADAVMQALAKDPARRPQTASDLARMVSAGTES
jgi:serine/threonine-protein kinase